MMQRQTVCLDHKEMALIAKRDRYLSGPKVVMVLLVKMKNSLVLSLL